MTTLVAVLAWVHDKHIDVTQAHPKLAVSILKVCIKHIFMMDKRKELFYNMKLSCRGAIRRAPNAASWVESLVKLANSMDPGTIIRSWNEECAKDSKIVGTKAQAVKNIMELPAEVRAVVLDAVSCWGWEGARLSNKVSI